MRCTLCLTKNPQSTTSMFANPLGRSAKGCTAAWTHRAHTRNLLEPHGTHTRFSQAPTGPYPAPSGTLSGPSRDLLGPFMDPSLGPCRALRTPRMDPARTPHLGPARTPHSGPARSPHGAPAETITAPSRDPHGHLTVPSRAEVELSCRKLNYIELC